MIVIAMLSFPVLLVLLWCRPAIFGLSVLALATILDLFGVLSEGLVLGVNVFVDDLVMMGLLVSGVFATFRTRKFPSAASWPIFLLLLLGLINLARGTMAFSLKSAGNGTRGLAMLLVPAAGVIMVGPALRMDTWRLAKWLGVTGSAFSLVAIARQFGILEIPTGLLDSLREVPRAINAEYALVVGQGLLAIVCLQLAGRVSWRGIALAGILASEVLVLQHRSVWAAVLVGLIWCVARTSTLSLQSWFKLGCAVLLAIATLLAVRPGIMGRVQSLLTVNVDETEQENSTWVWRTDAFKAATEDLFSGDVTQVVVGEPAGWDTDVNGTGEQFFIHSRYVHTLVVYGCLGLFVFMASIVALLKRTRKAALHGLEESREAFLGRIFLQSLLLTQMTYYVAYNGGIMQGALMGLVWLASEPLRVRRIVRRPVQRIAGRYEPITLPGSRVMVPVVLHAKT